MAPDSAAKLADTVTSKARMSNLITEVLPIVPAVLGIGCWVVAFVRGRFLAVGGECFRDFFRGAGQVRL
ncbi:hypothetical protein [Nocardia stercoris]|uniref:Uncharacterized protein n=1 Tax=Nocardia stercoris TaxID=2483361 RepID=A0A3M2KU49_9NOCA|nr:hypothetical protein [Nocardia stercoris]RMI28989.1 hypothetical protein EBN03_28045 [Nocardia stercoris]